MTNLRSPHSSTRVVDVQPVQEGPAQPDKPAGVKVQLDFPQTNDPTDLHTVFDASKPQAPEPKDVTVKLPAGVSISPGASDGLQGCSDLASDPAGDQIHYDNIKPVTCPDASIIGSATADTPLLASRDPVDDSVTGPDPLPGIIYLIKPHPGDLRKGEDGTFRVLLQLNSNRYGVNFKLPGTVKADKETGQLTATFLENPQLPASQLKLNFKTGPRAPLAMPTTCGTFTTTSDVVPWSTPGTPDATPSSSFTISQGADGASLRQYPGGAPLQPDPRRRHPVHVRRQGQPLHTARRPQGRRTGVQLSGPDRSEGIHRLAQGRLLLRRGRDRRRGRQERRRRAGEPRPARPRARSGP